MLGSKDRPFRLAICYVRQQRVFIHASSKTEAGFYCATPPWLAVDLADPAAVNAGIGEALASSKAKIPTPDRDSNTMVALYELAGMQTWGRFASGARSVHVEQSGEVRTFRPMRNLGPRNGFQPIEHLAFDIGPVESASSAFLKALQLAR